MKTLIVVDMQPDFEASQEPKVLSAVRKEIDLAIKNSWAIIFLEYGRYHGKHQSTDKRLLSLVKRYDKVFTGIKWVNNGSDVVKKLCSERADTPNKIPEHFRVCGVNTAYCVLETVLGLKGDFPAAKIEVVRKACNDWNHSRKPWLNYEVNGFQRKGQLMVA